MRVGPPHVVVLWDEKVPKELRETLAPALAAALRAAPAWCTELSVFWDSNVTSSYASMTTRPEYRNATLTVNPSWLDLSEPERAEVILHEVVHIAVHPLVEVYHDLLDALPDAPETLKRWAREQSRRAMEGVTQDVTAALLSCREPDPWGGLRDGPTARRLDEMIAAAKRQDGAS